MKLSALLTTLLCSVAVASSFERKFMEVALIDSNDDFTKPVKKSLKAMLNSPELTDDLLEQAFKPCIHNKLPACKHIIAECGMRLPQEDVDLALVNHVPHSQLFIRLLQGTKANPNRYSAKLFEAYQKEQNQHLLPFLMACPRFDPTVDNNIWARNMATENSNQELILTLSDARVAASVDITALLNSAVEKDSVWTALILAAHPQADFGQIDRTQQNTAMTCLLHIEEILNVAKSPNGQLTDIQKQLFEQLMNGAWTGRSCYMAIIYACLCSGNLSMVQWIESQMPGGKFKGPDFNSQYFGEVYLQMASTAACHGHLPMVQYLLEKVAELEEDEMERILDIAHKANQYDIADWIMGTLRKYHPTVAKIYNTIELFITNGQPIPESLVCKIIEIAKNFSLYDVACPAVTGQIIKDVGLNVAIGEALGVGIPLDVARLIIGYARKHPIAINDY